MPTSLTHDDLVVDELVAALDAAGADVGETACDATATLLDSFDGRLHHAGLRLELHEGGAVRELLLASSDSSPAARLAWDGPPPRLAPDLPRGPFGARVAGPLAERALLPLVEVISRRRDIVVRDRRGKAVVHVAIHAEPTVVASAPEEAPHLPRTVVEVHGVLGHTGRLEATSALLAEHDLAPAQGGLLDLSLAALDRSPAGFSSSPTVPLDPSASALDGFRAVLRNLLTTIDANLPGTLDDLDPEFLHELRVAVRRTRSVLAEGKKVLPADVRTSMREGFGQLQATTGRTRDLDVYVLGWDELVASLDGVDREAIGPLRDVLEEDRLAAHAAMAEVLTSPATRALLDDWRAWLDGPLPEGDGRRRLGPHVAARIHRAQDVLLTQGRAISPDSPPEDLHDLRKDAKKLRYLLECFGSLFPSKARKAFVGRMKALQDDLGAYQDLEVQVTELRELAHRLHGRPRTDTATLLATGRLIDHLEQARARARDEFVERFADYDSDANRRALAALLAPLEEA